MDFSQLLKPALDVLWYLVPLLLFTALLKSPWFKGMLGEFVVNLSARWFLDKETYHLIRNVTLPTPDGTTQIDHVIVSRFGLFVVETKNMKGWIFGSPQQKRWTQKIYKHTQQFQNPLHQNYKHLRALQGLLDLTDEQIHSVVVFVGSSEFKTPMPDNVTQGGGYIRFIKSKREPVLTDEQVQKMIRRIQSGRLAPSVRTHQDHVRNVRQIVSNRESERRCPKCGSLMVEREAKRGAQKGRRFRGCSNYPKCWTVLDLD
ncbi:NERD domain-containing protein [Sedimenticola selenatireducens]|uniref:nuclease-related domain-containing protein n=1 Tax=Sedimenticola selenatireducens TaxID=191960 RepID=UPI002AAC436C|nr:NERD domain-containing protein [Sedimenticola selenatireducens]